MPENWDTIGRWIHLPTAGGASDRFRAAQPLSAGAVQVACSNIEMGARENSLRTLWEHPGQDDIAGTLGFGAGAGAGTRPDQFDWDADPDDVTGSWVAVTGPHRIRPYGSTGLLPTVTLRGYASCGGTSTAGILLCARPRHGRPTASDLYGTASVTSTTLIPFGVTLAPLDAQLGRRLIAPQDERSVGAPVVEQGTQTELVFYVGVYTDGAGKAAVRGLTLTLDAPPGY